MNIGIVGGGGIGSYYAGILSRAGSSVRLITRGEHLTAINARGLEVRTPTDKFVAPVEATNDGARLVGCDYVVVAVKGYSLDEVAPNLVVAAKSGAAIAPLLNGVDVAERLEARGVPRASIIGGLATVSLFRIAPGVVEQRSVFDRVVFGELDHVLRDRTTKLVDIFARAGSTARVSDDMPLDLWRKFAFIVPITVACGLSRQPAGRATATDRGRALIVGALREIVAVSRASGVPLGEADEVRLAADLIALQPGMQPSFLLDLERGGPTELDLLAATVCRLGRAAGVATPIHDVASAAFEAATLPTS